MRRKKYFSILLIVLLIGCQSNNPSFAGEGEYWSAEVIVHQESSNKESEDIILTFKGDNAQSVGATRYSLEATSWSKCEGGFVLSKEGIYMEEGKSFNEKKTNEDETLAINIEWDGKSESFQLINKN